MSDEELLERHEGGVAHLTLNRPRAMNAVTVSLATALRDACLRLEGDDARVIVLRGAGEHFSVGGDFRELAALRERGEGAVRELLDAFGAACEAIIRLRVPVVAAVRGYALAGGFELLQCCDVTLLGESARIGDHHANMGVVPAGGGSQRLPRIVGRPRALAHMLTGEHLTPDEAVACGLAHRVCADDELDDAVATLAHGMAERDPVALATTKALVNYGLEHPLSSGLDHEIAVATQYLDRPEGMGRLAARGKAAR